jgi:hypothetical protein
MPRCERQPSAAALSLRCRAGTSAHSRRLIGAPAAPQKSAEPRGHGVPGDTRFAWGDRLLNVHLNNKAEVEPFEFLGSQFRKAAKPR